MNEFEQEKQEEEKLQKFELVTEGIFGGGYKI